MFAGIPPVVLPHGGATELVVHNETGLIARDPLDYARCLRYLFEHPDERRRLGRNAAGWVRKNLGARATAASFSNLYTTMLAEPKRCLQQNSRNRDGMAPRCEGAYRLLLSLEGSVPELVQAFQLWDRDLTEIIESAIEKAAPGIADIIVHYRTRFPDDPLLTFWAGLVLLGRDRPALAAAEFARSVRNGNPHARPYLARATARGRP
jgi:hypothetical protein